MLLLFLASSLAWMGEEWSVVHGSKTTAGKKLQELVDHSLVKQAFKGRFRNRSAIT